MSDELTEAMEGINREFRDLDQKLDDRFEIVDQDLKNLERRMDVTV